MAAGSSQTTTLAVAEGLIRVPATSNTDRPITCMMPIDEAAIRPIAVPTPKAPNNAMMCAASPARTMDCSVNDTASSTNGRERSNELTGCDASRGAIRPAAWRGRNAR